MQERLQKIIARAGVASRRASEELITGGKVRVNGHVVTELGAKADVHDDKIEIDGQRLVPEVARYLALHKPRGVVSTMSDPEGRPTISDLLRDAGGRLYPVGRLDFATSGLLLVTNDGDFANGLLHPSGGVPKTYVCKLKGNMQEEDLEKWTEGVQLEDGKTLPAEGRIIRHDDDKTWIEITLREGRNQQIRRMGDATRFPVMRLARMSFAGISSEGLKPGEWRPLTLEELQDLKKTYGVPKRVRGAVTDPLKALADRSEKAERIGKERKERAARGRPARPTREKPAKFDRSRAERPVRARAEAGNERPARAPRAGGDTGNDRPFRAPRAGGEERGARPTRAPRGVSEARDERAAAPRRGAGRIESRGPSRPTDSRGAGRPDARGPREPSRSRAPESEPRGGRSNRGPGRTSTPREETGARPGRFPRNDQADTRAPSRGGKRPESDSRAPRGGHRPDIEGPRAPRSNHRPEADTRGAPRGRKPEGRPEAPRNDRPAPRAGRSDRSETTPRGAGPHGSPARGRGRR